MENRIFDNLNRFSVYTVLNVRALYRSVDTVNVRFGCYKQNYKPFLVVAKSSSKPSNL